MRSYEKYEVKYLREGLYNMKIGFFDSGIGGLSVLHYAANVLPNEEFLFYMDSDHVPYGDKPKSDVIKYVDEAVRFMYNEGCKAVVIACNTATAVAVHELRKKFAIPIIGIEPAVKPAVEKAGDKRVMVIATPLTVKEEKLRNLIDRVDDTHCVDLLPLHKLVYFAENLEFDSEECYEYLKSEFEKFDLSQYSELVLGCTHYNYFKNVYRRIIPDSMMIIDGIKGTTNQLIRKLEENKILENNIQTIEYYESGRKITDTKKLQIMEQLHDRLEKMQMIK